MPELSAPPKHKGLFHDKPVQPDLRNFSENISNLSRRLRLQEESSTNMRRVLQVTEQNMLSKSKIFSAEIRTLASDIHELKKEVAEIKERILQLIKELQTSAKREELKILEKYINLWNPVKFVTQNEVEAIVKELIEKHR